MKLNSCLAVALAVSGLCLSLRAAAPQPVHSGCVTQTEAGDFTYCEPDACSVLVGKLAEKTLAGHSVRLLGTVQEANGDKPRTMTILKIVSIGAVCTETCSPRPPTHRGLGLKKDKPGVEAGTPGRSAGNPQL